MNEDMTKEMIGKMVEGSGDANSPSPSGRGPG
jgi:hypothetical protein